MSDTRDMTSAPTYSVAEIAKAFYGDSAVEVFKADRLTDKERRERTQARVGLASNVLGLGAGAVATGSALHDERLKEGGKVARGIFRAGQKVPSFPKKFKVGRLGAAMAGGALGLQLANVGGDAVANRVLARSAGDGKTRIKKSDDIGRKLKLKALDTTETQVRQKAPVAAKSAKAAARALKDTWTAEAKVSKAFEDKRQVYGWASITELNGEPVVDLQGDYVTIEEIEKAAYTYVSKSRKGGNMHRRDGEAPFHAADLIESVVITPEKKEALGLDPGSPTGWWVGFQVHDEETWNMVKDGKRPMFSIHGSGRRVETEV